MKTRSRGRTITEADIVLFSAFSGDWYPLHTDIEYASRTPFKQRIAHGLLVLSVASGLIKINPGVVYAFYGMERVRFLHPTFIGDTLYVESEVLEKVDKGPTRGLVTFRQDVVNHRGEVVCTSLIKVLLNKRTHKENAY